MRMLARLVVAVASTAVFISLPVMAAGAQVYKWKDLDGSTNYSDNPSSKHMQGAEPVHLPKVRGFEEEPGEAQLASVQPPVDMSDNAKVQDEITKNGVRCDCRVGPSSSGKIMVTAVLTNDMPYPAGGVRVDVILYTVDRQRLPDIEIRVQNGKIKPDWLGPGETVELSFETEVSMEQYSGHNMQVKWASVAQVPESDKTGPGVREVLVNKKTGVAKEAPKSEAAPQSQPEAHKSAM